MIRLIPFLLILIASNNITFSQILEKEIIEYKEKLITHPNETDLWNYIIASRYVKLNQLDSASHYIDKSYEISDYQICRMETSNRELMVINPSTKTPLIISYIRLHKPNYVKNCNPDNVKAESIRRKNIKRKLSEQTFDQKLIACLRQIKIDDQKYRGQDFLKNKDLQKRLDALNLNKVDSIIHHYGRYPGASLVGEEYDQIAAMVIHHNSIHAGKYIPILIEAIKGNDLDIGFFRILLKRHLHFKYSVTELELEQLNDGQFEDRMKKLLFEIEPELLDIL